MRADAAFGLLSVRDIPRQASYSRLLKAERLVFANVGAAKIPFDIEKLWWKVLWVIGIHDVVDEVKGFFAKNYPDLLDDIWKAIKKKDWEKARKLLKKLLGILKTDEFEEFLIKKLGKKKAKDVMKRIGLRLLPGFGWLITAGMILAAIVAQFII